MSKQFLRGPGALSALFKRSHAQAPPIAHETGGALDYNRRSPWLETLIELFSRLADVILHTFEGPAADAAKAAAKQRTTTEQRIERIAPGFVARGSTIHAVLWSVSVISLTFLSERAFEAIVPGGSASEFVGIPLSLLASFVFSIAQVTVVSLSAFGLARALAGSVEVTAPDGSVRRELRVPMDLGRVPVAIVSVAGFAVAIGGTIALAFLRAKVAAPTGAGINTLTGATPSGGMLDSNVVLFVALTLVELFATLLVAFTVYTPLAREAHAAARADIRAQRRLGRFRRRIDISRTLAFRGTSKLTSRYRRGALASNHASALDGLTPPHPKVLPSPTPIASPQAESVSMPTPRAEPREHWHDRPRPRVMEAPGTEDGPAAGRHEPAA